MLLASVRLMLLVPLAVATRSISGLEVNSQNIPLTFDDCQMILKNSKVANHLISSCKVKNFAEYTEGFVGEYPFVTIRYVNYGETSSKSKSLRVVMKILNGSSHETSLIEYVKEDFFYSVLLREYGRYNISTSFSPKAYFSKPYLIVLEDMSQQQYVGFPPSPYFLDIDHCKVALNTIAKFHSSGILYELRKTKKEKSPYYLLSEYPNVFRDMTSVNESKPAVQWFKQSMRAIFKIIPMISVKYYIQANEFIKRLQTVLERSQSLMDYFEEFRGTTLHGDLWFKNFLFKYDQTDIPVNSVLLDYQLLTYGPPSADVLQFIYTNTRKAFRDQHFQYLIEYYYQKLNTHFQGYNLEYILPKGEYLRLCKELQIFIKFKCICDRCTTLSLLGHYKRYVNSKPNRKTSANLNNRRIEIILSMFQRNAAFREILTEDILELYILLLGYV